MTLHIALVKTGEEKISSEKAYTREQINDDKKSKNRDVVFRTLIIKVLFFWP